MAKILDWLINYKTADGKGQNKVLGDAAIGLEGALKMIEECSESWKSLSAGSLDTAKDFYLGEGAGAAPTP